jgi:two-component system KDP operon response regulator KdpE
MHEKKNTILVVDQELQAQKMLAVVLDGGKFNIVESASGKDALRCCVSVSPDLVLLGLDLPDMDGKDVITAIREWSQVPIIVLSARQSDREIALSLNMGANDYVTKPFNADVLLARIYAALRTGAVHQNGQPELSNGDLRMDLVRHEVFLGDDVVGLTPKEYDLLRHFMVHRGRMLTHREILKEVWGPAHGDDVAYLRVYVGQIRHKIDREPTGPSRIVTEPGIGYRMEIASPIVL